MRRTWTRQGREARRLPFSALSADARNSLPAMPLPSEQSVGPRRYHALLLALTSSLLNRNEARDESKASRFIREASVAR
jgi:hypothetical protein